MDKYEKLLRDILKSRKLDPKDMTLDEIIDSVFDDANDTMIDNLMQQYPKDVQVAIAILGVDPETGTDIMTSEPAVKAPEQSTHIKDDSPWAAPETPKRPMNTAWD